MLPSKLSYRFDVPKAGVAVLAHAADMKTTVMAEDATSDLKNEGRIFGISFF
jgi:hypothetical protein